MQGVHNGGAMKYAYTDDYDHNFHLSRLAQPMNIDKNCSLASHRKSSTMFERYF